MSAQPRPTAAALIAAYERDDVDAVIAAYPDLADQAREEAWAVLGKPLSKAFLFTDKDRALSRAQIERQWRTRALLSLAIGPADVATIVGAGLVLRPEADAVIATRSEEWRTRFVSSTIHSWATEPEVGLFGNTWWDWWRWVRRHDLARSLPVEASSVDYLVVMVRGLLFSGSIVDAVMEDPSLAEGPIWALFEPAPAVQKALLGSERFWNPANTWRVALVRLALAGVLDIGRLERAARAAADREQMGPGHRAWYRRIPVLLRSPETLPTPPEHGSPPPGNQLYPRLS